MTRGADKRDLRSDQSLWPLLIFGLTLAAVGFYLAFRPAAKSPSPDDEIAIEPTYLADGADLEPTDPGEPVMLAYRPDGERRLALEMRQGNGSQSDTHQTRLAFTLSERLRPPDQLGETDSLDDGGPAVVMEWDFDSVAVTVKENNEEVGRDIVDQVDRLLAGTKQLRTFDRIGVPLSAEWTSVTNPQVRETLALVRHAQTLLVPRLSRGRVNAGESWIYQLKSDLPNPMGVGRLKGSVHIETVYLGNVTVDEGRELAVLQRKFSIVGTIRSEEGEDPQTRIELEGKGKGTALFEPSAGRVVESRITLDRTLTQVGGSSTDTGGTVRQGNVELYLGERSIP